MVLNSFYVFQFQVLMKSAQLPEFYLNMVNSQKESVCSWPGWSAATPVDSIVIDNPFGLTRAHFKNGVISVWENFWQDASSAPFNTVENLDSSNSLAEGKFWT